MKKNLFFLVGLAFLFSFTLVSSNGCCYYSENHICSMGVSNGVCSSGGGEWSGAAGCASDARCNLGCCVLGGSTLFTTEGNCLVESRVRGFEPSWQAGGTLDQCTGLAGAEDMGACVYSTTYETICNFVSRRNCDASRFNHNVLCSNPSLNTTCIKTTNTKCFEDGNVYHVDSCGNRDELVRECNYAQGSKCKQVNSREAICESLNCVDYFNKARRNGESWCVKDEVFPQVGTTTFLISCIEGELVGSTCGATRESICVQEGGDAKCVANNWGVCSIANRDSPDSKGSMVDESMCDSAFCYVWRPEEQCFYFDREAQKEGFYAQGGMAASYYDQHLSPKDDNPYGVYCGTNRKAYEPYKVDSPTKTTSVGTTIAIANVVRNSRSFVTGNAICISDVECGSGYTCTNSDNYQDPYASWICSYEGRVDTFSPSEVSDGAGGTITIYTDTTSSDTTSSDTTSSDTTSSDTTSSSSTTQEDFVDFSSDIVKSLKLEKCVPQIPGGQDLSPQNFISTEGVCSDGNYDTEVNFAHSRSRRRWDVIGQSSISLISISQGLWGNVGLISLFQKNAYWVFRAESRISFRFSNKNPLSLAGWKHTSRRWTMYNLNLLINLRNNEKIPDPIFLKMLEGRSENFGDCAPKMNQAGRPGSVSNGEDSSFKTSGSARIIFSFKYESKQWKPSSSLCDVCNGGNNFGMPCNEYSCQALGRDCKYVEPRGIDSGICISSGDLSSPSISSRIEHNGSTDKVPPFSPVKIIITTNKDAYCKFDFSSQAGSFDGLRYETSGKFASIHEFFLSVPGRYAYDEDYNELPLLTRDGKYELFIRCEGVNGQFNLNPHVLRFEVMDTPDGVPPSILEFVPKTNSFIEFNRTEKEIRFRLNEPAECRWDFQDKLYEDMGSMILIEEDFEYEEEDLEEEDLEDEDLEDEDFEEDSLEYDNSHQFSCDLYPSESASVNGYWCSGILPNITTQIGQSTKYYIRCKDQYWLEENNPDPNYYSRNANPRSFEYVLRPSLPLNISSVSPSAGDFIVGSNMNNITYEVRTSAGAENGKAECRWRYVVDGLPQTAWQLFDRTNSSSHQTELMNLRSADYQIYISCSDVAGNVVEEDFQMNIVVDTTPPILSRLYNDKGTLRVSLNEQGSCKFITGSSCSRVYSNGTSMNALSGRKEFTTNLIKNTRYSILCEDDFKNSRCFDNIIFH